MSTTATVARGEQALNEVYEDYKLHIAGASQTKLSATQREQKGREECLNTPNPPTWPKNYRRIPKHRPINRYLDPLQRPNGASTGEYVFVNVMLNGVRIQSKFVTLYEATGGKIWPDLLKYNIGGEW